MPKKITKIIAWILCIALIFEQSSFAQIAGQLDISAHFSSLHKAVFSDKYRPLHLRYLSYNSQTNHFNLLLDRGTQNKHKSEIERTTRELLKYFFIGLSLPNEAFWVNLRPDYHRDVSDAKAKPVPFSASKGDRSEIGSRNVPITNNEDIIDPLFAQTDIGRIFLEADVQLKKDTAQATSPQTPEGKKYWDSLYRKAEELFGSQQITIPTLTRPWIVPSEVVIRETKDNAYIYKATLKVMLEEDYLQSNQKSPPKADAPAAQVTSNQNEGDPRLKTLNEYSSQLLREIVIPKLTKEINMAKRYAALRQVYYSLILAQWFKARFKGKGIYGALINTKDLKNLTSKEAWTKETYFNEYQRSFKEGEYNIKLPIYTQFGQSIRSYFSGGIVMSGLGFGNNAPVAQERRQGGPLVDIGGDEGKPIGSGEEIGVYVSQGGQVQITSGNDVEDAASSLRGTPPSAASQPSLRGSADSSSVSLRGASAASDEAILNKGSVRESGSGKTGAIAKISGLLASIALFFLSTLPSWAAGSDGVQKVTNAVRLINDNEYYQYTLKWVASHSQDQINGKNPLHALIRMARELNINIDSLKDLSDPQAFQDALQNLVQQKIRSGGISQETLGRIAQWSAKHGLDMQISQNPHDILLIVGIVVGIIAVAIIIGVIVKHRRSSQQQPGQQPPAQQPPSPQPPSQQPPAQQPPGQQPPAGKQPSSQQPLSGEQPPQHPPGQQLPGQQPPGQPPQQPPGQQPPGQQPPAQPSGQSQQQPVQPPPEPAPTTQEAQPAEAGPGRASRIVELKPIEYGQKADKKDYRVLRGSCDDHVLEELLHDRHNELVLTKQETMPGAVILGENNGRVLIGRAFRIENEGERLQVYIRTVVVSREDINAVGGEQYFLDYLNGSSGIFTSNNRWMFNIEQKDNAWSGEFKSGKQVEDILKESFPSAPEPAAETPPAPQAEEARNPLLAQEENAKKIGLLAEPFVSQFVDGNKGQWSRCTDEEIERYVSDIRYADSYMSIRGGVLLVDYSGFVSCPLSIAEGITEVEGWFQAVKDEVRRQIRAAREQAIELVKTRERTLVDLRIREIIKLSLDKGLGERDKDSLEKMHEVLLELFDKLSGLKDAIDYPMIETSLIRNLIEFIAQRLASQDEDDLRFPFTPHGLRHSLQVTDYMLKVLESVPGLRGKLQEFYGSNYEIVVILVGLLHDIGYSGLKDGEHKGYHADVGRALIEDFLKANRSIVGFLRIGKGGSIEGKTALDDMLDAVLLHGADKRKTPEKQGDHEYTPASDTDNPLLMLLRLADNLDVTRDRLNEWQKNPWFHRILFKLYKDGRSQIQKIKQEIKDGTISKEEGLRQIDTLLKSLREEHLLKLQRRIEMAMRNGENEAALREELKQEFDADEQGLSLLIEQLRELAENDGIRSRIEETLGMMNEESLGHFLGALAVRELEFDYDQQDERFLIRAVLTDTADSEDDIIRELAEYQINGEGRTNAALESLSINGKTLNVGIQYGEPSLNSVARGAIKNIGLNTRIDREYSGGAISSHEAEVVWKGAQQIGRNIEEGRLEELKETFESVFGKTEDGKQPMPKIKLLPHAEIDALLKAKGHPVIRFENNIVIAQEYYEEKLAKKTDLMDPLLNVIVHEAMAYYAEKNGIPAEELPMLVEGKLDLKDWQERLKAHKGVKEDRSINGKINKELSDLLQLEGLQAVTTLRPGYLRVIDENDLQEFRNVLQKSGLDFVFDDGLSLLRVELVNRESIQGMVRVISQVDIKNGQRRLMPTIILIDVPGDLEKKFHDTGLFGFFPSDDIFNRAVRNALSRYEREERRNMVATADTIKTADLPSKTPKTHKQVLKTGLFHEVGESLYVVLEAEAQEGNNQAAALIDRWEECMRKVRSGIFYWKDMLKIALMGGHFYMEIFADKFALAVDENSIFYQFKEVLTDEEKTIINDIIDYFKTKHRQGKNVLALYKGPVSGFMSADELARIIKAGKTEQAVLVVQNALGNVLKDKEAYNSYLMQVKAELTDTEWSSFQAALNGQGQAGQQETAQSAQPAEGVGGVDMTAIPVTVQRLNEKAGIPITNIPIINLNTETEHQQIEKLLRVNMLPSNQRIKNYFIACLQQNDKKQLSQLAKCLALLMRLQEDAVIPAQEPLIEFLTLFESNKPAEEVLVSLSSVKIP